MIYQQRLRIRGFIEQIFDCMISVKQLLSESALPIRDKTYKNLNTVFKYPMLAKN